MSTSQLSSVLEANSKFNNDLKKYFEGKLSDQVVFNLGNSFGKLSENLDNFKNLYMRQGILSKALKGHDTSINVRQLENLPLKLYKAKTIFKSKKPGSLVVAIDMVDSRKQPVVVAIKTHHTAFIGQTSDDVNVITSIHGRPKEHLMYWKSEGLELRKGQKINSTHIQSGTIPDRYVSGVSNSKAKVAQENQTTKSLAEKMSELTEKNTAALRATLPQQPPHRHKHKGKKY
ncbi:MAG: hypothetical protein LBK47_06585 [Prevotellaceae bacterium]|jgi:hypothetical protein|nr:hypothetical protein [Prevotellaceae bacterium]